MAQLRRAVKTLEAAFCEAGIQDVQATPDAVWVYAGREYAIEVKPISIGHGRPQEVRNALAHVQLNQPNATAAFVAEHFTDGALQILRENRANYLDDCHFYFQVEEPFIAIKHDRACQPERKPLRERVGLGGRIGIAVQEMLLGERDKWRVTDLAAAADVAVGTAQAALQRLQDMELMVAEGVGPRKLRRLVDKGALLDLWVVDARKERHRLLSTYVYAQGPKNLVGAVSARLQERQVEHAITGAAAALLLAPHATDVRICEVWVGPNVRVNMLTEALGVEPVERGGNVVFLQTKTDAPLFRAKEEEGIVVANPLRVYADLLEDPKRGQEQADFLRQVVLRF